MHGTSCAGLNWQKHMLTAMELDQDSYWKRVQVNLMGWAVQHYASSPVLLGLVIMTCEGYLYDGPRCVLDGIRHLHGGRQANFHANVKKTKCW